MGRPGSKASASGSSSSSILQLVLLKPEMKEALSHLSECRCGVTQRAGRDTENWFCINGRAGGWVGIQLEEGAPWPGFPQAHPKDLGQGLIWKIARVRKSRLRGSSFSKVRHPCHFLRWFLGFRGWGWGWGFHGPRALCSRLFS